MPVYSEKVMEHIMNPHNVGEIENPDGVGEEGNPVCGDMMTFYIKVKDNRLEDVKLKPSAAGLPSPSPVWLAIWLKARRWKKR